MLGNEVQTLIAAFKLGAVVIPAATLLVAEDLRDRLRRGEKDLVDKDVRLLGEGPGRSG